MEIDAVSKEVAQIIKDVVDEIYREIEPELMKKFAEGIRKVLDQRGFALQEELIEDVRPVLEDICDRANKKGGWA